MNKKKGNKQINKNMDEELSKELELQIKGAEKPSVWELLVTRFILLPYTLGKLLLWNGCWMWRYHVKRAPYSLEDASYLTRRSLGVPFDSWKYMGSFKFLSIALSNTVIWACQMNQQERILYIDAYGKKPTWRAIWQRYEKNQSAEDRRVFVVP